VKKTQIHVKRLSDGERAAVHDAVRDIVYPASSYRPYVDRIKAVRQELRHVFADLIDRKDLSRSHPHYSGAIKVENLPVDEFVPPPPVQGGSLKHIGKPTSVSENVLTLIASFFGEPYSMFCEGRGLVNNLVPTQTT
jgi:hypothetical protein